MTPEQLREACAAAGVETRSETGNHFTVNVDGAWLFHANKGVIAYIAELLCALAPDAKELHTQYCRLFTGLPSPYMKATAEQRITAAMRARTGNQEWGG